MVRKDRQQEFSEFGLDFLKLNGIVFITKARRNVLGFLDIEAYDRNNEEITVQFSVLRKISPRAIGGGRISKLFATRTVGGSQIPVAEFDGSWGVVPVLPYLRGLIKNLSLAIDGKRPNLPSPSVHEAYVQEFRVSPIHTSARISERILWRQEASGDNIRDAANYLMLNLAKSDAVRAAMKLHKHRSRIVYFKAKDILRAASLQPLLGGNARVARDLIKIRTGAPLNPVLIVVTEGRAFLADGYHRVSACYEINENVDVACVRVHL